MDAHTYIFIAAVHRVFLLGQSDDQDEEEEEEEMTIGNWKR